MRFFLRSLWLICIFLNGEHTYKICQMKGRDKAKQTVQGPVFLQPVVAVSKKQDALAILLIIAVNVIVYYNSLYGDFCFDDHLAIANNGDSNGGNDVTDF